ncbi:MAG: family 1 glycosylhydrolase [Chloroflexi bacterium]|nr:family 1 glycosylhydrolase [Chloroflexota bacterium]
MPDRSPPLPASFLFGVGTSDHQCEAFDSRFPDVWDDWEMTHEIRHPGRTCCVPRGRATDFWYRYPEDIERARQLGCSAFRFSIAWARVEPEPGRFSEEALAHYRRLAQAIHAAGMQPVVTLMHFVWPRHVEARGGLRAPQFPAWFGAYATHVRDALGDLVQYWITINEPNALLFGYLKPFWLSDYAWPPGLPPGADNRDSMRATAEVIRNLFLANRAARIALRTGPGGEHRRVSANSYYLGLPNRLWRLPIPLMQFVDWRARSEKGWAEEDWELHEGRLVLQPRVAQTVERAARQEPRLFRLLDAIYAGAKTFATLFSFISANWWELGQRGHLPTFLCPPECRGQLDYVAFDYYFGTPYLHEVGRLADVVERRYDRAPIWAGGLYDALHYFQAMFPRLPVFVIENGMAGPAHTKARARYLRDHIREIQRARRDGVHTIGYLAWSLTTNREWGLPAGPAADFGLYHIDLDRDPHLTRHPTPATLAYSTIVRRRRA